MAQRVAVVTGASGFLGRAVVESLAAGWRVRCTTRREITVAGCSERLRVDLMTGEGLLDVCRGADAVVHCAGLAHQFRGAPTALFHDINTCGTERVAAAAVAQKVPRLVVASSIAVYGTARGERDEESPCHPETEYGRSKLAAEESVRAHVRGSQSTAIILRLATLFGPCDPGNVARLAEAIRRRQFLPIGSGRNRKSLLHCADAADAIERALNCPALPGETLVFNVSAPPLEMREVVHAVTTALGRRPYRWVLPAWPVHYAQRMFQAAGFGEQSPLRPIEKFVSEDVVTTARFQESTGFVAKRLVPDGLDLFRERNDGVIE